MNLRDKLMVRPGDKVRLSKLDPALSHGFRKDEAAARLDDMRGRLSDLQYRLYAEGRRSLLIVLQALDAGGKDGVIRHVMSGINPQGCRVTSFKAPTREEMSHDFLWRIHRAVPAAGEIGIFNRSHYEDVLVVRVHDLAPKSVWSRRYDQINEFEAYLERNQVTLLKFFLFISKEEQKERFEERLKDPEKNWKLSPADFEERRHWDDYLEAYEEALTRCSTAHAPWFIIPANRKWFRNLAVSRIIVDTLEAMDLKFPKPSFDVSKVVLE